MMISRILREYIEIVAEKRTQPLIMYHGTQLKKVRGILKHGLVPSKRAEVDAGMDRKRWATLGGVYLTSDFAHAVKIAKEGYRDIAVVVAQISPKSTTPDEDVVEKALIKSFTRALDDWGVDDAYEADLRQYADAEEDRPREYDEPPFDRQEFFREFWTTVRDNMAQIAGAPTADPGSALEHAVELAVEIGDAGMSRFAFERWQKTKALLIKLYPKLRLPAQHAQSGLDIPHNVRLTEPLGFAGRNRILAVIAPAEDDSFAKKGIEHWKPLYGALP